MAENEADDPVDALDYVALEMAHLQVWEHFCPTCETLTEELCYAAVPGQRCRVTGLCAACQAKQ